MGGMTRARFLTPSQVAELLGLEVESVLELGREGRISAVRVGSPAVWRIDAESVDAYLADRAEDARRRALWRESQNASIPEVWGGPSPL